MSSNLGSCDHCYHVSGLRTEDAVVRDPGRERHVGSQLPEPVVRTHSINGTSLNPPPQALGMREVERFLEAPCKGRDRVESKGLLHRGTPLSTLGALSKETALWAGPGSHHLARGTGIVVPSSPKGSVLAGGGVGEEVTLLPARPSSGLPLSHITPITRHKELQF